VRCMERTNPTSIFTKGDIKSPMQGIFNPQC
jgi:hypothetical protein